MTYPLVSVVTITYNHEMFIGKCIEGVLSQKTNFPIEYIIAEDHSTDHTRIICEKYAKDNASLINLLPSERNVGYLLNEYRAMKQVRGKYIAFCEGDDYWTDPLKLQRQIDFMENNPEYSVCFHRCSHYNEETGTYSNDKCDILLHGNVTGVDITIEDFFKNWVTQPLSMVLRVSCFELSLYHSYKYYRDMHQIYHLLKKGKGYLFAFNGGVRIIHNGGIASKQSIKGQCSMAVNVAKELYDLNKDIYTKAYLQEMLQWYLYNISDIKENRWRYAFRLFLLNGDFLALIRNIKR